MSKLKIIPLGGMGRVTQNMYLYVYEQEILIVDCGIGFPDNYMPGVDVLIPDINYLLQLLDEGKRIVGMLLTHGHDDHIAAMPYILPLLPADFPIFAAPLTAGFAQQRLQDREVDRSLTVITDKKPFKIGQHFQVTAYAITHSVPDTKHFTLQTPAGLIYHGTDFKLDDQPVDGVKPDYAAFRKIGQQGVLCMLLDCLRVERALPTPSESTTGPVIEKLMAKTQGKFIVTLMSSHLHRIQQTVTAAQKHGRKVVFIGRSVEQNVAVALSLHKIKIPKTMIVDQRDLTQYPDRQLCVIIAGSQGQEGSSLMRAIFGEHRSIKITSQDVVVFSADAIPGNELNYFGAIDELARNKTHVLYPDIVPNLHQSGHGSAPEQRKMVELIKPRFIMPIGGAERHRIKFVEFVAAPLGIKPNRVLLPRDGEVLAFSQGKPQLTRQFQLRPQIVDGKGVGDVGPMVLADRRTLSEAGIIVLVIPRRKGRLELKRMLIVSRGFVFMKEADEVIEFIKEQTAQIVSNLKGKATDSRLKQAVERKLSRKLYKIIQREPMILPVIYELP